MGRGEGMVYCTLPYGDSSHAIHINHTILYHYLKLQYMHVLSISHIHKVLHTLHYCCTTVYEIAFKACVRV